MSDAEPSTTPPTGRQASLPPSPGEESFPKAFGQYLLLDAFARGGMGEVYLAKIGGIAGLEKYCVLKKLRQDLTRDREYVTRFIDEARVVVTLNHANICHVFDVGRVGDEYYLAMEYISGRDLRVLQDRARAQGRQLPPQTVLHMTCEILEALDYAHRRKHPLTGEALNLVHRDVSPQNVLVSYEGEVKLIDFGLAASRLKVERTQPNIVMGKMAYMAPEQARGDGIDARADLFAAGVVCYELLVGERFYENMSANDIWQVAGRGNYVPPRWKDLDPDLAKILGKALHADYTKRYATCGDFREALAAHLHWRYPGTGVRSLRDVMNEVFADEIAHERDMLARFGRVSISTFKSSMESTKSHSVAKSEAEPGPILPAKVGLAVLAPETTPKTGAVAPREVSMMASARTQLQPGSSSSDAPSSTIARDATVVRAAPTTDPTLLGEPRGDIANQPTVLEPPRASALTTPAADTVHDERTVLARDERLSRKTKKSEPTEVVARPRPAKDPTLVVAQLDVSATTPPQPRRGPSPVLAGAIVGVLLLVVGGAAIAFTAMGGAPAAPVAAAAPVPEPPRAVVEPPPPAKPAPVAPEPPPTADKGEPPLQAEPIAAALESEPISTTAEPRRGRPRATPVDVDRKKPPKPTPVVEKAAAPPAPTPTPPPPPQKAPSEEPWLTRAKAISATQCDHPCKKLVMRDLPAAASPSASPKLRADFSALTSTCAKECGLRK